MFSHLLRKIAASVLRAADTAEQYEVRTLAGGKSSLQKLFQMALVLACIGLVIWLLMGMSPSQAGPAIGRALIVLFRAL